MLPAPRPAPARASLASRAACDLASAMSLACLSVLLLITDSRCSTLCFTDTLWLSRWSRSLATKSLTTPSSVECLFECSSSVRSTCSRRSDHEAWRTESFLTASSSLACLETAAWCLPCAARTSSKSLAWPCSKSCSAASSSCTRCTNEAWLCATSLCARLKSGAAGGARSQPATRTWRASILACEASSSLPCFSAESLNIFSRQSMRERREVLFIAKAVFSSERPLVACFNSPNVAPKASHALRRAWTFSKRDCADPLWSESFRDASASELSRASRRSSRVACRATVDRRPSASRECLEWLSLRALNSLACLSMESPIKVSK
mmetsp:Transcript_79177/g.242243  ORF Transcript_79177/g.242243 Transcript_79177/m.242243 type:complete len:323 (-) Transcript_79177:2480-3448(-)